MFTSRLLVIQSILVFAVMPCQAKPLSFNGVQVGQKWEPFLKAHPKAEVFWPSDEEMELSKAQQLQRQSQRKEALLIESVENQQLKSAIYFFQDRSLTQAIWGTDLNVRGSISKGLVELKPSLQKMLSELGAPTEQGITELNGYSSGERRMLLTWRTATQCAFAVVTWPTGKERVATSFELHLVNARWRTAKPGFETIWPAVLPVAPQDEIRRRELYALLEKLQPHSTAGIGKLTPAPSVGLSQPVIENPVIKNKVDQTPKPGVPISKSAP